MTTESVSPSPTVPPRTAPGPSRAPVLPAQPPRAQAGSAGPAARRRPTRTPVPGLLLGADALAAALAAWWAGGLQLAAFTLLPVLAVLAVLHSGSGLYRPGLSVTALEELPRLLGHATLAWGAACAVLAAAHPPAAADMVTLLALVGGQALLACPARGAVRAYARRVALRRPASALVIGTAPESRRVLSALYEHPEYGMRPVGLVRLSPEPGPVPASGPVPGDSPLPVLTSTSAVTRAVVQNAVRHAVLLQGPETQPRVPALIRLLWSYGCTVWLLDPDPVPGARPAHRCHRDRHDHLWGYPCRRLDPPRRPRPGGTGKRTLDLVVAVTALAVTAPLQLACAGAVRLADGPGVLFRQQRVGLHGRPFVMLKFRTLRPTDERESATRWNVAHDGRMSAVGRLLRRTSLDELPQLWNVLRGDMSLVGPRPERPYFVSRFSRDHPGYADRHRMPVGITGLAQVNGLRGDTSIEDRVRFDNHYIDTWSLWQDVRILVHTAGSCVRFRGC
ncbi:sugar transferase [Streptomyces sp. ACA25]|uniref:sugar transferase n=1 Tax=Streptomyces sp. ACA25 TaxID=3022596 RepID=UPI002307D656|nr:sugar transferase [Streptomyces sp. ACA25]MDB1086297.1 sugar transferase [Streptomyces sp. ACA25]